MIPVINIQDATTAASDKTSPKAKIFPAIKAEIFVNNFTYFYVLSKENSQICIAS